LGEEPTEREETISYERLYRLWEENNWSATGIDFSVDREHWDERLTDLQREAALWNYAMFLVGEESVARTLTPVVDAAPGYAESIFLATQLVDEVRHHVFFDRFMREVAGRGEDTESTLDHVRGLCTWGFDKVFAELDDVTDSLRRKPRDLPLFAQTLALYHLVVEGMLAIPGQHFIKKYVEEFEILPGFAVGIRSVARDESRHVAFGVKCLGELVSSTVECRDAAIELWDRVLPWAVGVFVPPNFDRSYTECFDFTLEEIYAFGLRSFEMKLRRIGIDPHEIRILSLQDRDLPYDERARRAVLLVEAGVIGDDRREPELRHEIFEILFDGMKRSMDFELARSLEGPVEWIFTDAEPWHLVVADGHIEAKPGRAGNPALQLETSSAEFAKIAAGRSDPRWAVVKRQLKIHGPLSAKAKLPRLFR
jgi:hypothetical protein